MKKIIVLFVLSFFYLTIFAQETGRFTDTRDGKIYKTVKIGDNEWFGENLAYKAEKGCWTLNNIDSLSLKYGRLYSYETAKVVSPAGWHCATQAEFQQLTKEEKEYLKLSDYCGCMDSEGKFYYKGTAYWQIVNNGSGTSGFGNDCNSLSFSLGLDKEKTGLSIRCVKDK